ncbi:hypothetical protein COO60DRAFT_323102 [Scenedesmus sp. NREL 46B-D3]|nr:hypothetical protein COO60DRAFT_323102 [Scenedesmus sp. NREL 46B-D3]
MASRFLMVFLACCAFAAMSNLPSAVAASGNRKMLDTRGFDGAVADARARAAAASNSYGGNPTYFNNNYDDRDDCRYGNCDRHVERPSYSACQSAAQAFASGTAVSRGDGGGAFSDAVAAANARSSNFGSDDWKNNFVNACSSSAFAQATSVAGSGK